MTNTIPVAMIATETVWIVRLKILRGVRKRPSVNTLKTRHRTTNAPIMPKRRVSSCNAANKFRAAGRFEPGNWSAYFDETGNPIAVLLLAQVAQGNGMELVYLGVAKDYRGKGVGGELMRYAVSESARLGGTRLYLAVDDRNDPAVRLYTGLGFRASTRKIAYVLPR